MRRWRLSVLVLLGATLALGSGLSFEEHAAVQESLSCVHPRFREYWLKSRGYGVGKFMPVPRPDSGNVGLRLVGKWGRGPSVDVTGRDTLVALSLGSEVALINFAQPSQPQVLSEIQLDFMPAKSVLADSLLIAGGKAMDIWDIADPGSPARIGRFPVGAGDFCVKDSLVCFVQTDSFRVYSIADPANPRLLGFYSDSGYVLAVTGNTVVVGEPSIGLYFVDISNPSQPKRVGAFASDYPLSADVRGSLCCASFQSNADPYPIRFVTLDISNPASVRQLARIDSAGGYGVYIWDTLAFASGRDRAYAEEFQVINIADSAHPHLLGRGTTPYDNWGVWACPPRHLAYVADRGKGLSVFDITDLTRPVRDTGIMVADLAYDVAVDGYRAYVADYVGGLRVLDVGDPTKPTELGGTDTLEAAVVTAVAKDSFAYANWWPSPYFRTFDVSDPTHPRKVAGGAVQTEPADMVLRDTLVFLAGRLRFNVVNVARPRQPVLVGSCVVGDMTNAGMYLADTLAYVCSWPFDIVNVADAGNPFVVGSIPHYAENVYVADSLAYLACAGLFVYNVKNPAAPVPVDSLVGGLDARDIVVRDTLAYVGCYGGVVAVVSVADLHNMRVLGRVSVPQTAWRLAYADPYVYAACFDAGVCIFETTQVAIAEPKQVILAQARREASMVIGVLFLDDVLSHAPQAASLLDVSGRKVMDLMPGVNDVRALAPGVYFVREAQAQAKAVRKVVLTE